MSISKFKKTKTLFLSLFIMLSSIFPFSSHRPPPALTSLSSPFTSPPFLLLHSFGVPLHFPFSISGAPLFPLWHFIGSVGVSRARGLGIRFFLSNTRESCSETLETMAVKPLQSADCVCVTPSLCISLLNFLFLCSRRSGMLKGKACEGALGSAV